MKGPLDVINIDTEEEKFEFYLPFFFLSENFSFSVSSFETMGL
jgi:hypothetical protein